MFADLLAGEVGIGAILLEIPTFTVGFYLRSLKPCFYFCNWLRSPVLGEGEFGGVVDFIF